MPPFHQQQRCLTLSIALDYSCNIQFCYWENSFQQAIIDYTSYTILRKHYLFASFCYKKSNIPFYDDYVSSPSHSPILNCVRTRVPPMLWICQRLGSLKRCHAVRESARESAAAGCSILVLRVVLTFSHQPIYSGGLQEVVSTSDSQLLVSISHTREV